MMGMMTLAAMLMAADPATCTLLPAPGAKLDGDMELSPTAGHTLKIENGPGSDAIVKLRHAATGRLAASFFLEKGEKLEVEGVPDGSYITQYAFGPALAADCRTFARITRANQLPEPDLLKAEREEHDQESRVSYTSLSLSLMLIAGGQVKPIDISAAAFNAP